MTVQVCIGSACHVRGSHHILENLQKLVEENGLTDQVNLKVAFCLGRCSPSGANVQVDDQIIGGVTEENLPAFFDTHIRQALK